MVKEQIVVAAIHAAITLTVKSLKMSSNQDISDIDSLFAQHYVAIMKTVNEHMASESTESMNVPAPLVQRSAKRR